MKEVEEESGLKLFYKTGILGIAENGTAGYDILMAKEQALIENNIP